MTYKELKEFLIKCSEDYYKKSESVLSDFEFDTKLKELEKIRSEYGKLGSGYPSDPVTRNYLKTLDEDNYPWFVRKTWNTIDSIQHENHEEK